MEEGARSDDPAVADMVSGGEGGGRRAPAGSRSPTERQRCAGRERPPGSLAQITAPPRGPQPREAARTRPVGVEPPAGTSPAGGATATKVQFPASDDERSASFEGPRSNS